MLDTAEARELIGSIDVSSHAGLRDRALIGLMVHSFAHIGAALGMTVKDVYTRNSRQARAGQGQPAIIVRRRRPLCLNSSFRNGHEPMGCAGPRSGGEEYGHWLMRPTSSGSTS